MIQAVVHLPNFHQAVIKIFAYAMYGLCFLLNMIQYQKRDDQKSDVKNPGIVSLHWRDSSHPFKGKLSFP